MFSNLKLRTKMVILTFTFVLVSVIILGLVGFSVGYSTMQDESFNKLTAVRELKAQQIENYFRTIRSQLRTLAGSPFLVRAMNEFRSGYDKVEQESGAAPAIAENVVEELRLYYATEFLERLKRNTKNRPVLSDYFPQSRITRLLQARYIVRNPHETGNKHLLDASAEESSYDAVHKRYHPILRDYLEQFGYYDIFLIDHITGNIVYSVFKEVDFATSLTSGPYRNSNIAEAFRAVRAQRDPHFVKLIDFAPYSPSYEAPSAFIAAPIFDSETQVGVLIFQMPISRIDDIMTSGGDWEHVGLGATGETYIVGADYRMRNQSRFLIEDKSRFLETLRENGIERSIVDGIANVGSTIGLLPVQSEAVDAALNGETGKRVLADYRNEEVLSAFGPLDLADVQWIIVSEQDVQEALAPVYGFGRQLALWFVGLFALIFVASYYFARSIVKPIQELGHDAELLAAGELDVEVRVRRRDEIGELAERFIQMRNAIKDLFRKLEIVNQRQEESIDALSTPLIPILDDVVAMPLVGFLDAHRINQIRSSLVEGVFASKAKVAILDLTAVPSIDEEMAQGLLRAAQAARLIGVQVIMTGMQPEFVERMVNLDVSVEGLVTERTLQRGINRAMRMLAQEVGNRRPDDGTGEDRT